MEPSNAQIFKNLRLELKLTQKDVAKILHMSERNVQRIEAGDVKCSQLYIEILKQKKTKIT